MTESIKCPVCGALADPSTTVCERCGFKLIGRTTPFDAYFDEALGFGGKNADVQGVGEQGAGPSADAQNSSAQSAPSSAEKAAGDSGKENKSVTGVPTLTIIKGPLEGETFHLTHFPMTVGRDPECDLFLNNMTVTRKHASIEIIDGEVTIIDLNSLNGTWIDGKVCDRAILKNGTLVQIGTFSMEFNI